MISFLCHEEGTRPFFELATRFPTVLMKYLKQIFYEIFQPENLTKLGRESSKYSLQRHFDRRHPFRPRESYSFPQSECAAVTLDSVMHFKNHAVIIHEIYMSDRI